MVKLPKTVKRLCKYCKKHTEHKVAQAKRKSPNSANPGGKGAKWRTGFGKGAGNKGRYGSRPAIKDFKMTGKKASKNFVFLFVGRLLKEKGIEELVEAVKIVKSKYPEIELWLLGKIDKDNPSAISEKKLESWQKLGLVKYLGFVDDVRPFLCQADCFVFPSYYREGIPKSLLEASAMEKPIIATQSVGCQEVIEEKKDSFIVLVEYE